MERNALYWTLAFAAMVFLGFLLGWIFKCKTCHKNTGTQNSQNSQNPNSFAQQQNRDLEAQSLEAQIRQKMTMIPPRVASNPSQYPPGALEVGDADFKNYIAKRDVLSFVKFYAYFFFLLFLKTNLFFLQKSMVW